MTATHAERVERLVAVVQELSRARTLEAVQEIVRHAARELTGADGATFVLREGDSCFYADEDAIAPLWKGLRFPMSSCVSGWAMLHREAAVIEDIYADPRVPADAYRPTFVRSMVMVPIRAREPLGAIGNYWAERRLPSDEEVRLLQALADSTSIALENVGLYRELEARIVERTTALEAAQLAEASARRELDERRRAEAALERTQEQLRHAQKMDAIGQLAGGIAHDFNNVLSVILGYCSIMAADLAPDTPLRADVEEIQRAGERAAALTTQLLAFSRQQLIAPKVHDLGDIVRSVERMLSRVIGEDVRVELRTGATRPVLVDAGQMEQVLLNLALNARDAMPCGGTLTIETEDVTLGGEYLATHHGVTPGEYVMLAVSDTGIGIEKDALGRIFEPFFTTKPPGRGTGLGLATVYGIVKQNGGHVWVYSEVGTGTTFKVYLPKHQPQPRDAAGAAAAPVTSKRLTGTETILVVEDDEQVRAVATQILRRHGYRVLEARNAGEALLACEQSEGPIHLMLTDLVMPQMSGIQLARHVSRIRPEMRVVCMSGFTDAALRHGVDDAAIVFVHKPLVPEILLGKLREVLDEE